ncbi:LrgB family protein [Oscillibacter hominis]|uniref:LrgB family protein n=1 Tax=Oscillibacter hominis TaxID=2763056 RepID=A0A7G9B668_9FIRM|nr:LrgB family protein [Oscillibacter hominis]QNL45049.1 LrgB family protein [Oscillibacter hominis]
MKEILCQSAFFGVAISLASYGLGMWMKSRWKLAVFNPLLVSTVVVIAALAVLRIDYDSYYEGAHYLNYFLTPSTVCLAIPLYEELQLLRKNWRAVLAGVASGVLASMTTVFLLCRLFRMDHAVYATLLPKSITTAIGVGVAEELGGLPTITAAAIIVTGIFGNVAAEGICRLFRIRESVARGIAIGSASHAMGTAKAMEMGEVEGAMSSLSIVVSGLLTVLCAPVFAGML